MKAQPTTYRDLDSLLQQHGFIKRSVQVDRGGEDDENLNANGAAVDRATARLVRGYLFDHAATGAQVLLPLRPSDEAVAPHHLHTVRRTLVDWGVLSDAAFDRWLCQVQVPDEEGKIAGVGDDANQMRVAD